MYDKLLPNCGTIKNNPTLYFYERNGILYHPTEQRYITHPLNELFASLAKIFIYDDTKVVLFSIIVQ